MDNSPSPHSLDAICKSNIDFVILDQEHGSISANDLLPLINVAKAHNVAPIVLTSHVNLQLAQTALDAGCYGVQFPNINNLDDAIEASSITKYPPIGTRGFSPFVPASNYTNNGIGWNKEQNNSLSLLLNIEGKESIRQVSSICKLDNIDCLFVGLFDLSKSLGIPGEVKDKRVMDLLREVVELAAINGTSVGTIATSLDDIDQFYEIGVNYIVYMVDMNVLKEAYDTIANRFNAISKSK